MANRGLFITIEGIDGSGKTTQIKYIQQYLMDKNFEVVLAREPGSTEIGEKVREIILDKGNGEMHYITEMLLYASARAQLVQQVIKPLVESGKIVICDRFIDSTYVYQSYGRGLNMNIVKRVNDIALDGVVPDITFFLDINPEKSLKRAIDRSEVDRIEGEAMEFHDRVYAGYNELASLYPNRIKRIQADVEEAEVFNNIRYNLDNIISEANVKSAL